MMESEQQEEQQYYPQSFGYSQGTEQNTQFLLKRIDPTRTNEDIKHSLMGEVRDNNKWRKYSAPLVRDKNLLNEIMAMVTSQVNSETRLAKLDRRDVTNKAKSFGDRLNKLLYFKGYDKAKSRIPFCLSNGEIKRDSSGRIEYSDEWSYVDIEGNTDYLIDINSEKKKVNPKFKCRVFSIDIGSYHSLILNLTHYVHANLTRASDGSEAELISRNLIIQEQLQKKDDGGSRFSNLFKRG